VVIQFFLAVIRFGLCLLAAILALSSVASAQPFKLDTSQVEPRAGIRDILGDFSPVPGSKPPRILPIDPNAPVSCGPANAGNPNAPSSCSTPSVATQKGQGPSIGAGNPINVINGNKYQQEADLPALPGVLGLEFIRHYNSAFAFVGMASGSLARGWRHSYDTRLYVGKQTFQVVQADGSRVMFSRSKTDPSLCHSADPSNGTLQVHSRSGSKGVLQSEYLWRWPDGREVSFNDNGQLTQIKVASGEFMSLVYDRLGRLQTVTDPQNRELQLSYQGVQIQSIKTPLGVFSYVYDASNLAGVKMPADAGNTRQRDYHYEDTRWSSLLSGISDRGSLGGGAEQVSRVSTYLYDEQGRAVLSTRGVPAKLMTDANGTVLVPRRLAQGSGVEQVHLQFVQLATPTKLGKTILTNALGHTTEYTYKIINGQYRLLAVTGAGCSTCGPTLAKYDYDLQGQLIANHDLQSGFAQYTHRDDQGRVVRQELAQNGGNKNLIARFEYQGRAITPSLIARPSVVLGQEHQWQFVYNEAGQVTQMTEQGFSPSSVDTNEPVLALSRTTKYGYQTINGRSVLVHLDEPVSEPNAHHLTGNAVRKVTQMVYSPRGDRIIQLVKPDGSRHELGYDAAGRINRVVDAHGFASSFSFNASGGLTQVSAIGPGWAQALVQSTSFDALGNRLETGLGSHADKTYQAKQRFGYDANHRAIWQANTMGVLEQVSLDAEGQVVTTGRYSPRMQLVERRAYNEYGQLESSIDNAQRHTAWLYDSQGLLKAVVDPLGRIAAIEATQSKEPTIDQLRDDFGRMVSATHADTGITRLRYDQADRLVNMVDAAGNHANYEYDMLDRIVRQTVIPAKTSDPSQASEAPTVTEWQYKGRHLISLKHPTQTERFEYDARGLRTARWVTLVTPSGEHTSVTRYEFDQKGILVSQQLPDGSKLIFDRDPLGHIMALRRSVIHTSWLQWLLPEQVLAQQIERDLIGVNHYVAGNGLNSDWLRSAQGTLAKVAHAKVLEHQYLWDTQGNLLQQKNWISGSHVLYTQNYAYDQSDQLIAAVRTSLNQPTILPVGTASIPLEKTPDGEQSVWRYAYDSQQRRVLSQQQVSDQSDMSGKVVKANFSNGSNPVGNIEYTQTGQIKISPTTQSAYRWNANGRLKQVFKNDQPIASYEYDHRGLRNSKTTVSSATYFLHDEAKHLSAELNADGSIRRQYVYLADQPLALIDYANGQPSSTNPSLVARAARDLKTIAQSWLDTKPKLAWVHVNHLGAPEAVTQADAKVVWRAWYSPFGQAKVQADTNAQNQAQAFALNLRLPGQYADTETGLHYNRQRYYDPDLGQYISPDPLGNPDGPNAYAYAAHNPLRYVDPDGLTLFAFDGTDNSNEESELKKLGGSITNVERFRLAYDGKTRYVGGVGAIHFEKPDAVDRVGNRYLNIAATASLLFGKKVPDRGGNFTGRERIKRMEDYFADEVYYSPADEIFQVDITGFSRGAAQARDFANRITQSSALTRVRGTGQAYWSNGVVRERDAKGVEKIYYRVATPMRNPANAALEYTYTCRLVNFRFMGLFDSVLSVDLGVGDPYRLGIPDAFAHVSHAIALNEYRSQPFPGKTEIFANGNFWDTTRANLNDDSHWGGFPLESIGPSSETAGKVRIERGFIGAHADVGGGYDDGSNQLSFVALNWMVAQATMAGVEMKAPTDTMPIQNPIIHDQSNAIRMGNPNNTASRVVRRVNGNGLPYNETVTLVAEDRMIKINGQESGKTQRTMTFNNNGMTNSLTHDFINYPVRDPWRSLAKTTPSAKDVNDTGTVKINQYVDWLRKNGYCFAGDACAAKK
jgi:RHS repeat-associated protein